MKSVWCVFGTDGHEYFLEKIFTTELVAEEFAKDCNRRSASCNYFVRERSVYELFTDGMRVPNDFGEDGRMKTFDIYDQDTKVRLVSNVPEDVLYWECSVWHCEGHDIYVKDHEDEKAVSSNDV